MKKAALHNLGCKVNSYETEAMEELLVADGYEIVDFNQKADVYLINTCSVTNIADRKSRQMIRKCKRMNPDSIVIATGCYIQNFGKDIPDELGADIILGNNKKSLIIEKLHEYLESKQTVVDCIDINDGVACYEKMHIEKDMEHTRAFVKVQDGCNQFCSYCIIPFARGRIRSREIEDVMQEITTLAQNGYKEIVITGIHLSSYGNGLSYDLADLLEKVNSVAGIERIRLGSLEPQIITEDFARRISSLDKICPHFHLSLQSGCDEVLKRMNRKYTIIEYYNGCEILRKYFSSPAITTDVIVGFPGESDEEFEITYDFLKKVNFYEMHVFQYSKRKGTKAERMPGQVLSETKKARSSKLIALANQMTKEYILSMKDKKMEVLFEELVEVDGEKYFIGFSKEYVKCAIKYSGVDLQNEIISVKGVSYLEQYQYLVVENS